jgi:hypothetical protein
LVNDSKLELKELTIEMTSATTDFPLGLNINNSILDACGVKITISEGSSFGVQIADGAQVAFSDSSVVVAGTGFPNTSIRVGRSPITLLIRNARASSTYLTNYGPALDISNATCVTAENSIFTTTMPGGGAIAADGAAVVTIMNSSVSAVGTTTTV